MLRYEDTGGLFANVRFDAPENLDLSTNASFTVQIYIPSSGVSGNQPSQLSLKLQDGTLPEPWITQSEIVKPVILDQWQTLTFDFANDNFINLSPDSPHPVLRTDFNRVLFQVNGENNTDPVLAFIDEVQHPGDLPPSPVFDQLIWADEFDGQGAIDSEKWFHQTLLPFGTSWFNGEIQHYTDRIENFQGRKWQFENRSPTGILHRSGPDQGIHLCTSELKIHLPIWQGRNPGEAAHRARNLAGLMDAGQKYQ